LPEFQGLWVTDVWPGDKKVYGVRKEHTVELRMQLTGNRKCFCFHGDYHFDRADAGNASTWDQAPKSLKNLVSQKECATLLARAEHHLEMLGIMHEEMYTFSKHDAPSEDGAQELAWDPLTPMMKESHERFKIQMERHSGLHPKALCRYYFLDEFKHPYSMEPAPYWQDPFTRGETPKPTLLIVLEPVQTPKIFDKLAMRRIGSQEQIMLKMLDGNASNQDASPYNANVQVKHTKRGYGFIIDILPDGRREVKFKDGDGESRWYGLTACQDKLEIVQNSEASQTSVQRMNLASGPIRGLASPKPISGKEAAPSTPPPGSPALLASMPGSRSSPALLPSAVQLRVHESPPVVHVDSGVPHLPESTRSFSNAPTRRPSCVALV